MGSPDVCPFAQRRTTLLLAVAPTGTMSDIINATSLATALGYLVGLGSLLLYTPIAVRLYRNKSANETALSTWRLKLASYTCSDIYYLLKGYPLSTYIETLMITVEATGICSTVSKAPGCHVWGLPTNLFNIGRLWIIGGTSGTCGGESTGGSRFEFGRFGAPTCLEVST